MRLLSPPVRAGTARLLPALLAFAIALAALTPCVRLLPAHGDETQYVWIGTYYIQRLAHGDLRPEGEDGFVDPGWAPRTFWAVCEPTGARFLYGTVVLLTGSPMPQLPYSFTDPELQGPETDLPAATLQLARLTAILAAAAGLGLIVLRLGWPAVAGVTLFLAIPHVRTDLSRAWAEGPLLLGYGISALAYRTRWFGAAVGLAATFKLTALGLWPVAFWSARHSTRRFGQSLALAKAAATWTALTPPAWFAGGPFFLAPMILYRIREHSQQSAELGGSIGLFLPTRYALPFELCLALLGSWAAIRVVHRYAPITPWARTRNTPRPCDRTPAPASSTASGSARPAVPAAASH